MNYNLELIHNIHFENADNNYGVSDVWGYTDEENNEYAIIGYKDGTSIINVSNNPPIEVANIIGPSNGDYYYHRDYKTYEDYLYIVNEMYGGDIGMQVIDLSPLPNNNPIQLDTYNQISQSHNLWIDESGLALIEHVNGDNIHIANLNNPTSPVYENTFGDLALNCHDIYSKNNIAYISEGWSCQFGIYDISNLNNIIQLATIPSEGYAHNAWLNNDGNILITTEETENKTIKIWDISNLNNINLLGEYLGENNLAHNVHIKNDLLYISHYTTGIKIVDIYNPQNPIEVAAFDTYPLDNNGGYYGCWGVYPFTNNNYIYASDMQNGLFIFNFDPINAGWIYGTIFSNDNSISPYTSIHSTLNNKIFFSDENGIYNFGFPEGLQEFIINETDTVELVIIGHEVTNNDIYLNSAINLGDINTDNIIDVLDIILMVNIILETYEPNNQELWLADINEDGYINII